ncbi:hypothetical protein P7H22_24820 [Paenibacillus larvae]|nr:hypothetical protein [Paenibacillus larvae]MDT2242909.1 hypothetical protein [Paenibacillus larvae]
MASGEHDSDEDMLQAVEDFGDEYPPSRVWGDEIHVGYPRGLPEASEK